MLSQSLLFFRAFQRDLGATSCLRTEAVAIPSFFQGISTRGAQGAGGNNRSFRRNPFFFSGHFNLLQNREEDGGVFSRNPFFFSGHFNAFWRKSKDGKYERRNPFFFSGHFNSMKQGGYVVPILGRNPFFFSGHFNAQLIAQEFGTYLQVAIPSFFQGISTRGDDVCH